MKTGSQLAVAVMRKGGWVSADESPSAADVSYIKAEYETKLAYWLGLDLVYWVANEIPEAVFPILVDLMLNEVGATFGVAQSLADKTQAEEVLLRPLRRHVSKRASGVPTKATYY